MLQKCTQLWCEAHFKVKMVRSTFASETAKNTSSSRHFPKTMAGVGHLKRICKDAFSVAGAVQETCSSEMLGGPGADFRRGVAFWSLRSSGLLRWFCATGAALRMTWHHFFVASAIITLDRWSGKSQNALVWGRQLCIQLSIFEGRLAELLRLQACR